MLIDINDINPTLKLDISGFEKWIAPLVSEAMPSGESQSGKLYGNISFKKDAAGFVYAHGTIDFSSDMPCHHCGTAIPCKFQEKIKVSWRPPYETSAPRDIQLTADDLDVYFIENEQIDVSQLLHDTIQCALPDAATQAESESNYCLNCRDLYSQRKATDHRPPVLEEPKKVSPFAVLETLLAKKK